MPKVHIIAIGGAVMHNLAIDLAGLGCEVTGSDDEIYEPALSRLKSLDLLPAKIGWHPEKITKDLDYVVLGMHAKKDNPELLKAMSFDIPVYSYPELIYNLSKNKKRVVIAGSHGKTTITSMILHVLKKNNVDFDYVVGAHIEGFDKMVKISDAPVIVLEGDEYLSSPLDPRPKIHHYHPFISVLTGIAWDHINVFPTYSDYIKAFSDYINLIEKNGFLIYNQNDAEVIRLANQTKDVHGIPYDGLTRDFGKNSVLFEGRSYPISVIGNHNLSNLAAAMEVCSQLGILPQDFLSSVSDFKGAAKRLQQIKNTKQKAIYLDFAHAPSKVLATTQAFKSWFGNKKLCAVFELHTFSSLDESFLPQYKHTLEAADKAIVYVSKHTLLMKNKPFLNQEIIKKSFQHPNLTVIYEKEGLITELKDPQYEQYNILLMTSGTFDQMDYQTL
ncbi:MAG: peptidoglycan synthetase [Saprospiraceae bacterium]|nr:peptidoglycan synthetase [Saprospiraceae bacterium]